MSYRATIAVHPCCILNFCTCLLSKTFNKPLIQLCVDPVLFSNERRHSTIVQARISLGCWVTTNKFCGYCNDRAFTHIALDPGVATFLYLNEVSSLDIISLYEDQGGEKYDVKVTG